MNIFMRRDLKLKVDELNDDAPKDLNEVIEIIDHLQLYLDKKITLNDDEISNSINALLISTITVQLPIPLVLRNNMYRARKCEGTHSANFTKTSELSYISITGSTPLNLGRMNKKGNSIFYASFGNSTTTHSTVLSEVGATKGEIYNIMECQLNPLNQAHLNLELAPIGVFDYYRRNVHLPFTLTVDMKESYDFIQENTSSEAMMALHLCDAFLTSILTADSDSTGRLYKLTSEVAQFFLEQYPVDGVVYPSTKIPGHPNVAIIPDMVDQKIKFTSVQRVEILESYGYGLFSLKTLVEGTIENSLIQWKSL